MSHKLVSLYIGDGEYYTRTDADAVIAELKAQKAQAEDDCAYWKMREGNAANATHETEEYAMQLYKELRHQKFKRCLAMARWCMTEYIHSKCLDFTNTEQWYWRRWHIRWLELAKKFKHNSTAQ